MSSIGNVEIRTITAAELPAFARQLTRAFGGDPLPKEDEYDFRKVLDLDRVFAAFDGDQIVGTCAATSLDLTVPGGVMPMGGTTMISVQPTHRRRGILRAMMREHIEEVRGRGEALAGLWCSESSIYGQFGFGSAAELCEMNANADKVDFLGEPPERKLRSVEPDEARKIFPAVYERVSAERPGMFGRSAGWWQANTFRDVESEREGRSAKRFLLCEGASGAEGYAIYQQREKWTDFPAGEIHVVELFGATSEAREALWRMLMNIDLFPSVTFWNMAVDDELAWRVAEPRRVQRKIMDSLWLRLLDIPRALSGRAYSASGRCVLGIRDPFLPENDGNYELITSVDAAECQRTQSEPDIECEVDALGSLFLGGHRATTLARGGRIAGERESLELLDRMFSWSPLPWCPEVF